MSLINRIKASQGATLPPSSLIHRSQASLAWAGIRVRSLGFEGLGFRVLGFRVSLGFRVYLEDHGT